MRYVLAQLQSGEEKEQVNRKAAAAAVLRRLDSGPQDQQPPGDEGKRRRPRKEDLALNQYEQTIAMDVVAPEDIAVAFGGRLFKINTY